MAYPEVEAELCVVPQCPDFYVVELLDQVQRPQPSGGLVEAFAARDGARPRDAALPFAWSTAATIEPWVDGERFFPRIFADVETARSSVHILMFGWREGAVGMRMASLLER